MSIHFQPREKRKVDVQLIVTEIIDHCRFTYKRQLNFTFSLSACTKDWLISLWFRNQSKTWRQDNLFHWH